MSLKWKILVPVIAVCVFVGMGVGVNFLLSYALRPSPTVLDVLDSSRIFTIMSEESTQRLNGTPLRAFTMLADPLEDGSITIDFLHRDPMFDDMETSGRLSLYSDIRNEDFAIMGELSSPFTGTIDLSIFLNNERIALGTNIFDENLYGIRFSTFEEDFQTFASVIGLDPFIVDGVVAFLPELAATITELSELDEGDFYIDNWDEWEDWGELDYLIPYFEPYGELFNNFIDSFEEQRTAVTLGGQDAIRYSYTIDTGSFIDFMDEFINLFAQLDVDGLVRETHYVFGEQIETQAQMEGLEGFTITDMMISELVNQLTSFQRDIVREMRSELRQLRTESDETAIISLNIYMNADGRLLRFTTEGGTTVISLDFGTSVYDPWVFQTTFIEEGTDERETFELTWEFTSEYDLIVNRISVNDTRNGGSYNTMGSEWIPSSGEFTLWVEEDGQRIHSIAGIFRVANNGAFELRVSDIDLNGAYLSIGISTVIGANIPNIDFINMNLWDETLIARIEELVFSMMPDLGVLPYF